MSKLLLAGVLFMSCGDSAHDCTYATSALVEPETPFVDTCKPPVCYPDIKPSKVTHE